MHRKSLQLLVLCLGIGCGTFVGPSSAYAWVCCCNNWAKWAVDTNDECIDRCKDQGGVGSCGY